MSQENVDLARRSWTADAFTELFDEHIVLDSRENPVPDLPAVSVGRDEAINTFRHYWGTWDEYETSIRWSSLTLDRASWWWCMNTAVEREAASP